MAGRQAKVLSPRALTRMQRAVKRGNTPERDWVIVLLSVKAGLRACEIARVAWPMVLDARGRVAHALELPDKAAKRRSGRRVPLHPQLRQALTQLQRIGDASGPVVRSARGGHMRPNSIVNWFVTLYRQLDLAGCSSHSGRRTFITQAARMVHRTGGSLRDVQLLAGHQSIETTQHYIDGDSAAQHRLVALL